MGQFLTLNFCLLNNFFLHELKAKKSVKRVQVLAPKPERQNDLFQVPISQPHSNPQSKYVPYKHEAPDRGSGSPTHKFCQSDKSFRQPSFCARTSLDSINFKLFDASISESSQVFVSYYNIFSDTTLEIFIGDQNN